MTVKNVLDLLAKNLSERGIEAWKKIKFDDLDSYGIGLTQLKSLAKKIPRDHELALQLWESKNYDAKIMGILIDDPEKVSREQIERQLKNCSFWMLSHIYCSTLLNKTVFAEDIAVEWADDKNDIRRRCSYLLIYQLAQNNKKLHNRFFEEYLARIAKAIRTEENFVKDAMNNALFMIGRRNLELNARAIAVAGKIGKINVEYGDNSCKALNVMEHLTDIKLQLRLKAR
jgi:3-methyladenine DNA glycosylase AlkD